MSNVSTVTPYESTSSIDFGEVVGGFTRTAAEAAFVAVGAAVTVAQWLSTETEADRAAVERLQSDRRQELLATSSRKDISCNSAKALRFASAGLHLRDPATLIQTAEKLGFDVDPLAQPSAPPDQQPPILLRSAAGERLAIERSREDRVVIHSIGDERCLQSLVRQHTLDRALEHLKSKGMNVQTAQLANGETQILAQERDTGQRDGAAGVKAQVRTDGTVRVDIECIKGSRCEIIVGKLAEAVGGRVSHAKKKKEGCFQLPGEPTKIKQQV